MSLLTPAFGSTRNQDVRSVAVSGVVVVWSAARLRLVHSASCGRTIDLGALRYGEEDPTGTRVITLWRHWYRRSSSSRDSRLKVYPPTGNA